VSLWLWSLPTGGWAAPSVPAKKSSKSQAASSASAKAVIKDIQIKGQKKIEVDAIRSKLLSKEGEPYDPDRLRQDVQALFDLGYFYDVQVDVSGSKDVVVTYIVQEKPSIGEIEYVGNSEIDDEEMATTTGLKSYEILNLARVQEAIEKMQKAYEEKGFFLARIQYKLEPIEKSDNMKLVFDIAENDKVKVKRITFLGNRKLNAKKLKERLATQEGSFFSFVSGTGSYKQDAFDRDMQILSYLYFNEGYIQVKVDRPEVYVTPDKKGIYITIRVDEGEQFNVGTVDFSGDLLYSREELFEAVKIDERGVFSSEVLQEDLRTLQAKYGDLGYAYANIIPRTHIREKDKEVDITFDIDKGNKVYIGKINVVGNTKTRDKVVRRELRIREGELYNESRKRESLANVQRLGFFEELNFNTKTPPGRNDLMDIDIVVKERNTGTIQVGAGYSSYQGFVFNGQVSQTNFLGRGQNLSASVDLAKNQELFRLNFTEPYTWDTEWSTGFGLFQQRRTLTEYQEDKKGASVRVGHPLAPYLNGYVGYRLDETKLTLDEDSDPEIFPVETANGTTSSLTFTLAYDKRNDRFEPTKGLYSSLDLEFAGAGGDKAYTKGYASLRYYKEVFWNIVWRNNVNYAFISSNRPGEPPPFNELFLLGGANNLRGYDWFTVGKRKFSNKVFSEAVADHDPNAAYTALRPFGGMQQFYYNLEFQFPLIAEAGIKGVVFYDIGDADDRLVISDLRQDYGFGFRWFSPIGPLRFEWGFPIQRKQELDEEPVNFQFAIGAPF
jgi:outer membrane protein insertion porin family